MKIQYREFTRPSACGEGEVFSRSWQPDAAPRAIIQIAHGMQEHAGRYDRFARRLAENGWAVYANDHIGHGKSAMGHIGTFSMMPGGFEFLLADMHTLFAYARDEHPDLPCALLGHSMGSIASGGNPDPDGHARAKRSRRIRRCPCGCGCTFERPDGTVSADYKAG